MKAQKLFCFGHRGACGYEPENTLRSVRKALEFGADGIEVDAHLADGRLMVIHDDTLKRTTGGAGRVGEKSFAYLRSLDAGKGERIPTLEEVFDAVNRRAVINVELKGPGTAEPVVRLIVQYVQERGWRYEDFLVSSFDRAQIQAAKNLSPEIRIGALIEKVPPGLAAFAERLGAWSLHPGKRCVTRELVANAHQRGLKVFVFTINRPADIALMGALGVDGVFTDFPDRVVTFPSAHDSIVL
ncbi:MAG TPA: glycerophosphodiester phosphodiesterase family protein [Verrucomicrobiae bacterium]|jgi:glycerophosphoryl diester phosphodiesterase